jgi:DNA-binding NarL/FixJ family response regulator
LAGWPVQRTILTMAILQADRMNENHSEKLRLCLIHERGLFRESLARLLAADPDLDLVAACETPDAALESLSRSGVQVVLLDLSGNGALAFLSAARDNGYDGKFLVLTSSLDPSTSAQALKLGASGIFLESNSSARLIQAVRLVASGEAWLDQGLLQILAGRYPVSEDPRLRVSDLTSRQQTVVQGVVDGLSNRKIADRLGMSEGTVKSTLQQLFAKAGVRTRSQLVRAALEGTLTEPAEAPKAEHVHS